MGADYRALKVERMVRVSVYLEDDVYEKAKLAAKKKEWSFSRYVRTALCEELHGWPPGFLDHYFGATKDDPMDEPKDAVICGCSQECRY